MSSTSFVSHHVLQGIQVKWCTNTIIDEVAVEAIQMKVHSDISVQMTLGHGTKVPEITYLTAPCRRARRDDRIGHLVHPIQSSEAKVMQIKSFGHVLCRGCRPAGLT